MRNLFRQIFLISTLICLSLGLAEAEGSKGFYQRQKEKIRQAAPLKISIYPLELAGQTFWVREVAADIPLKADFAKLITTSIPLADVSAVKGGSATFKKIFITREEAEDLLKNPPVPKIPFTSILLDHLMKVGESFNFNTELNINLGAKSPQFLGFSPVGASGGQTFKGQFQITVRKISEDQIELFLVKRHNRGPMISSRLGSQFDSKTFALNVGQVNLVDFVPQPFGSSRSWLKFHSDSTGFKVDLSTRQGRFFYDSLMVSLVKDDALQVVDFQESKLKDLEFEARKQNGPPVENIDIGIQSGKENFNENSWALTYVNKSVRSVKSETTFLQFRDPKKQLRYYSMNEITHSLQQKKLFGIVATHLKNVSMKSFSISDRNKNIAKVAGYEFGFNFGSTNAKDKEYADWNLRMENFIPSEGVESIKQDHWFDHTSKINPNLSATVIFTTQQHNDVIDALSNMNTDQRAQFLEYSILEFLQGRQWPHTSRLKQCWAKVCSTLTGNDKPMEEIYERKIKQMSNLLETWLQADQSAEQKIQSFEKLTKTSLFSVIGPAYLDYLMKDLKIGHLKAEVSFRYKDTDEKHVERKWGKEGHRVTRSDQQRIKVSKAFDFYKGTNSKYTRPLPALLQCMKVFDTSL